MAAALIITERMGRGIRLPSRDVMLSYATSQVGHGWGFGLHNALDQTGAIIGPLIVAVILYMRGSYQMAFAFLLLPAVLALIVLVISRFLYPYPTNLEVKVPQLGAKGFNKAYWLYIIAIALIAAGFADFALIAYHFQKTGLVSPALIPIFYAVAMGVDALAALLFGKLFDKVGIPIMILVAILSALFAPLVFFRWILFSISWNDNMGCEYGVSRIYNEILSSCNDFC
jgi:predicted MFS family arabinose efflux permease